MNQFQTIGEAVEEPIIQPDIPGVVAYGADNAYPNRVALLASKVPQAWHGLLIQQQFLAGKGIQGPAVEEFVNAGEFMSFTSRKTGLTTYLPLSQPQTLAEFDANVRAQCSLFGGCYVHIGFMPDGLPGSMKIMEFENMRITSSEHRDHPGKFVWWNNWGNGKRRNRKDIAKPVYYSPYTGDNDAAKAEMDAMGGDFPGQVFYMAHKPLWSGIYPLSPANACMAAMDTARRLNTYTNNLVRQGYSHGQTLTLPQTLTEKAMQELLDRARQQQGEDKAGSLRVLDGVPDGARLTDANVTGLADQYRWTEEDITRKIRMGIGIPQPLFGDPVAGKLGNTAELKDAFEIYNQQTSSFRAFIARSLRFLFANTAIPGADQQTFEVEMLAFEGTTTQPQPDTQPAL